MPCMRFVSIIGGNRILSMTVNYSKADAVEVGEILEDFDGRESCGFKESSGGLALFRANFHEDGTAWQEEAWCVLRDAFNKREAIVCRKEGKRRFVVLDDRRKG